MSRRYPGIGKTSPYCAIELAGNVLGHLDVLHLVLADRHDIREVDEYVRCHQDRVGEQADARLQPLFDLLLVGDGPLEKAHVRDCPEDPGQFGHLRHVGLAKEDGLLGVEPEGQVIQSDVARVLAEDLRILNGRQGMEIGDEVEADALFLEGDVLLDGAEVIPQVELTAGLNAAQKTRHASGWNRGCGHFSGSLAMGSWTIQPAVELNIRYSLADRSRNGYRATASLENASAQRTPRSPRENRA